MAEIIKYDGYKGNCQLWDFLWASYKGGPSYKNAYDSNGEEIWISHELETDKRMARRLRHATYKNYCKTITDKYRDFVYRGDIVWPPKTDDTPRLNRFLDDCDNNGTTFAQYMRNATRMAQVMGEHLIGIDAPLATDGEAPVTQGQEDQQGLRCYVTQADIRLMVDYESNGRGFDRIVLEENFRVKGNLGESETWTKCFIEWLPEHWVRYDIGGNIIDGAEHKFGCVPWWIYSFDAEGSSQIADIAECSRKIFNLASLLDEELYSRTFTQTFITGEGIKEGDVRQVAGGNSNVIVIPHDANIHYKGADPNQAASILNSISVEIKEIWRQAGLESGDPTETKQPESGTAKAWAFHSVEQLLKGISDTSEENANFLLSKLVELEAIEGTRETKANYPDSFDVTAFAEDLENSITMMTINKFPLTASKELIRNLIAKQLPKLKPEIAEAINAEIDAIENTVDLMDFTGNSDNLTE
jgi:hypothetical protein